MRSIEECKAEVFRRSEDRISKRRKNIFKSTLIGGLSTVACILLVVGIVRLTGEEKMLDGSEMPPLEDGNSGNSGNATGGIYGEGSTFETAFGVLTDVPVDFEVQYTHTHNYREGFAKPSVTVIRSMEELNSFYESNSEQDITEACNSYNDKYFENQNLIVVTLSAGSGSIDYRVREIVCSEGEYIIKIERVVPEIMTMDMVEWNIFVEPKELLSEDADIKIEFLYD